MGSEIVAHWVQIGPGGALSARVVTQAPACPRISLDGEERVMDVRARPSPPDFPVLVCEREVPAGVTSASIEGRALPRWGGAPARIAVVGDSGCRLKRGRPAQACLDPAEWPFARVAGSIAAWKPDLVIHLGDFHYREVECPKDTDRCAGSPWGDRWETWYAELFLPAAPLLRSAHWLMVRGNHERCARAGQGWFRFLDPRRRPEECRDHTEAFTLPAGDVELLVVDSSAAHDTKAPAEDVAIYTRQLANVLPTIAPHTWLVTHRPLWGVIPAGKEKENEPRPVGNATLATSFRHTLPARIRLVFGGHIHLFEAITFAGGLPPLLIAGHGGTTLDAPVRSPLRDLRLGGVQISHVTAISRHGFVALERTATGWVASARDADGAVLTTCPIVGLTLRCQR